MTPILILAAGASRRMGGADKLLEPVDGIPLLRLQAMNALTQGEPVFVALPAADHPRARALDGLAVTILAVPDSAEGMGGSMRGAVAQLPVCARFMLLLGDLAAIEAADIASVMAAPAATPDAVIWRGATEDGKPGHPIVFDATLRPEFAALTGDSGGEPIVRRHLAQTVMIPLPGNRARRDLDTPDDWAAFRTETGR